MTNSNGDSLSNRNKSNSKRLLTLASVVGLILACICLATFSASWVFKSSESTASESERISDTSRLEPVQFITETPSALEPIALQSAPTATASATATPSSTPTPTFTPAPTHTPTQTSTPTPTATSLPQALPSPTTTQVKVDYVVIISVDGLRPDALDKTDTPTLDALRAKGAYSSNAQTVVPSATLIGHASMLGGMTPEKHGIYWNLYNPELGKVNGPTLFSVAHEAGLRTVMVVGKIKLEQVYLPHPLGSFDANPTTDTEVKDRALEIIHDPAGLPSILFIHFPDVDVMGHQAGWMSPEQLKVVNKVDGFIGEIVAALESAGYLNNTLLIVTADHGGHDKTHLILPPLPEDTTIPWLAIGPGVPAGKTLTRGIFIYDTAATALDALDLPIPDVWDGRPVLEFLD